MLDGVGILTISSKKATDKKTTDKTDTTDDDS